MKTLLLASFLDRQLPLDGTSWLARSKSPSEPLKSGISDWPSVHALKIDKIEFTSSKFKIATSESLRPLVMTRFVE